MNHSEPGNSQVKDKSIYFLFNISIFTCILMLALSGCAVTGEEKTLITALPESTVVTLGGTKSFYEKNGTSVSWSVEGVLSGNEGTVIGTIDSDGLYTAPTDEEVAPEKVVVRATDASGSTDTAHAYLTTFKANKRITTHFTSGNIEANTYSAGQRGIAVNGDNVFLVWADNSVGSYYQAFFTMSKDGGDNFCKPIRISGFNSAHQFSPAIAVYKDDSNPDDIKDNVYVVWEDYRDGDGDIYFARFDGSGCGWETTLEWSQSPFTLPVKVNDISGMNASNESSPAIAIDSKGGVYVVWEDRSGSSANYPDIYFVYRLTPEVPFTAPISVDKSGRKPAVAIGPGDMVYVAWEDIDKYPQEPTNIKLRRIVGITPGDETEIPVSSGYNARSPSIAVDPDCGLPNDSFCDIYVVWQRAQVPVQALPQDTIRSYDIVLSIINGDILSDVKLPNPVHGDRSVGVYGGYAYPSVAADDSSIYVVWDDWRNGVKDIYYAKSSDGVIFTTNRIVNDGASDDCGFLCHEKPSIAVFNGKAYVIWTDYRNAQLPTTAAQIDVFFAVEQ